MTYRIMDMDEWYGCVDRLDYAFQPIICSHTGRCFAVEALLRNWKSAGFESIFDVFDTAFDQETLFDVDIFLREKAIKKFAQIDSHTKLKLFYNIDNRIMEKEDYFSGKTGKIINSNFLTADALCFELSERFRWNETTQLEKVIKSYKDQGYPIAIDDYGSGFSGLQLLYSAEPMYIKIDRFFIKEIDKNARKKLFVTNIIKLAHTLGIKVIAEGIETTGEYFNCIEIGCDYLQGYFIAYPKIDISVIRADYSDVCPKERRACNQETEISEFISNNLLRIKPVNNRSTSFTELFRCFKENKTHNAVPVTNDVGEPVGIIPEHSLKEYVYAPFGKEILEKGGRNHYIAPFIIPVPSTDITSSMEHILELFYNLNEKDNTGYIFITDMGCYIGMLSATTLLNAIHERELKVARDINPLTGLFGNVIIRQFVFDTLTKKTCCNRLFVYFDFDYFKPFNDYFGFRIGDRAIQLFADTLKSILSCDDFFIGHVGGDDFFCSADVQDVIFGVKRVTEVQKLFSENVKMFYDNEHCEKGAIELTGRDGEVRYYPLLSVSAAVIVINESSSFVDEDTFYSKLADLKKKAKIAANGIVVYTFNGNYETGNYPEPDSMTKLSIGC